MKNPPQNKGIERDGTLLNEAEMAWLLRNDASSWPPPPSAEAVERMHSEWPVREVETHVLAHEASGNTATAERVAGRAPLRLQFARKAAAAILLIVAAGFGWRAVSPVVGLAAPETLEQTASLAAPSGGSRIAVAIPGFAKRVSGLLHRGGSWTLGMLDSELQLKLGSEWNAVRSDAGRAAGCVINDALQPWSRLSGIAD
ncbi:MAG: hypothetical protein ACI841_003397 [Planctomycetota bacterium]